MHYASATPLLALFDYLEHRNVDPAEVAGAGVVAFVRKRAVDRVPAWLGVDLLERCAARLDDPLFGLRYGQQIDPKSYGPISLLWRYAPTVRYSNRITMRILHLQHEGVAVGLRDEGETTSLIYRADPEPGRAQRQFVESGVSFMLKVCRLIMGAHWVPQRVIFAHPPVDDPARYADVLAAPVTFDAVDNGLVVLSNDLDRRSPDHNAEILAFVERSLLRVAEQEPLPFRERLERVVDDLLAIHKPQLSAAAAAMAMSSRSLQRQLAGEGTSFRDILSARRRHVIDTWRQRAPRPSLALLAERTAFSEASAVSRFLRRTQADEMVDALGLEPRTR